MARELLKRISVLVCVISAAALISDPLLQSRAHAADKAVASVIHVDKAKRQVHVSNPKNSSFKMGETLSLRVEGQVVVLRVKTPMASQSYCVIEQGSESLGKIAKGMFVYRGIVKIEEDLPGPVETRTFAGIEMVLVPSNGLIPSFYIGKFEVTQKQYESITGKNPSKFKGKPDRPVDYVSWYEAVEFCNRLSKKAKLAPYYNINKKKKDPGNKAKYDQIKWTVTVNKESNGFRLPTSEEWDYARRAGTRTRFYWGDRDDFDVVDKYEVYKENSDKLGYKHEDYGTHPVGGKKPNGWGLHDMNGNVFEWCFDWSAEYPGVSRYTGGGSWFQDKSFMRSGEFSWNPPDIGSDQIGFRLVKNP